MTDLTQEEQDHVRRALRYLYGLVGGWVPLAKSLGFQTDSLEKVANARGRAVTGGLAIRVARLADVAIEDVLDGTYPPRCPTCGQATKRVSKMTGLTNRAGTVEALRGAAA